MTVFGLNNCEATSKILSGYAKWLGDLRKAVDDDRILHPENYESNQSQLAISNEGSKDLLFKQLRGVANNLSGSNDMKGLVKDIQNLLMLKAEAIANSQPGMSKIYYERMLSSSCSEVISAIKLNN